MSPTLAFTLDGQRVEVEDEAISLLEALRERLGNRMVKDGCSPQGQCGCCTVLVDGSPRVACVTPLRRVADRSVTTLSGLPKHVVAGWAEAFCATGASQCGFCTPGIITRLAWLADRGTAPEDTAAVGRALSAHLCRCTGWRTIFDAWGLVCRGGVVPLAGRDLAAASRRASLEGGTPQTVSPEVALGRGGFADDTAPADALVAVPDAAGGWAVGASLAEARSLAVKVQGRRTTVPLSHPIEVPPGEWDVTLRTTWVEPAYLETDASWCRPGGEPASPLANGGAFGAKLSSPAPDVARRLADEHGRAVRVVLSREDSVRLGPKRPPVAGGARADGSGTLVVARTPGMVEAIVQVAPDMVVEEVDVVGPPTSVDLRAAGWAEALVLLAGARGEVPVTITSPAGATATAEITPDGAVAVRVSCGEVLDEVVLRSYCIGAAHMALSWVRSEGIAVAPDGVPEDLTVRSFGILRASEMPDVHVEVVAEDGPPVNGSDAVFVAVAAAAWVGQGCPPTWPTGSARA